MNSRIIHLIKNLFNPLKYNNLDVKFNTIADIREINTIVFIHVVHINHDCKNL